MKRQRRSLWKSISTSIKVNALSAPAVILYTFGIAHLDDEGYMDGDPRILKSQVVPLRDDIPASIVPQLTEEIATIHEKLGIEIPLWVIHRIPPLIIIQDPASPKRQSFKGVHKIPSDLAQIVDKAKQISFLPSRKASVG